MPHVIDKKAVWEAALATFDESPASKAMFWMLWNECYLDSVEDGVAIIGVPSSVHLRIFQQKAQRHLRDALEEELGYPVIVRPVIGNPRLFTTPETARESASDMPQAEAERHELQLLHERYGDIMGIVDNHPVFKKAATPLDKGGWGIWPQKLTIYCKDYGVLAVLNCLRFIANKPNIRRPRGFFYEAMDRGQFGHRLVITQAVTGPAREADENKELQAV